MLPPVWEDEAHHFETCYLETPAYEVCVARNVWSLHMSLEHTGVWCLVWTKSVRNYTGCPLDCRIFNAMKCWSDTNCCKHEKIVMAKSGPPMSFIYSCSFFLVLMKSHFRARFSTFTQPMFKLKAWVINWTTSDWILTARNGIFCSFRFEPHNDRWTNFWQHTTASKTPTSTSSYNCLHFQQTFHWRGLLLKIKREFLFPLRLSSPVPTVQAWWLLLWQETSVSRRN